MSHIEHTLAFAVPRHEPPALEVRVNFGVFAGREATPAEIDELASTLLEQVSAVSIVAEERHEIDGHSEASIHQVRVEIGQESLPTDRAELEQLGERVVAAAEQWATACIAERQVEVSEL
ncbi:MAG: hypothetical protein H0V79_06040 [Actinobacteria bacterium]|nr:hypothetical protein [Actinomycetota bacterium]